MNIYYKKNHDAVHSMYISKKPPIGYLPIDLIPRMAQFPTKLFTYQVELQYL